MQVLKSKRITSIGFALLVFAGGCKTNTTSRGDLQADPGFNQETGRIRVYACKLDPIPNIYLPDFTVRNIIALDQSSLRLLSPEDDNGSVKFVDTKTSIERENPNSSVKFRKRGTIHISESTFQSDGETLFRENQLNLKSLKHTWARGAGKTKEEAKINLTITHKGDCDALDLPFTTGDPAGKQFAKFLDLNHNWGTSVNGKILSLGGCHEQIIKDAAKRLFKCNDGFAQIISPMGTKICEIQNAQASVIASKKYRKPLMYFTSEPKGFFQTLSFGKCRWK